MQLDKSGLPIYAGPDGVIVGNAVLVASAAVTQAGWRDVGVATYQRYDYEAEDGGGSRAHVVSHPLGGEPEIVGGAANWVRAGGGTVLFGTPENVTVVWPNGSKEHLEGAGYPVGVSDVGVAITTPHSTQALDFWYPDGTRWHLDVPSAVGNDAVAGLDVRLSGPWLTVRTYGRGTLLYDMRTLMLVPGAFNNAKANETIPFDLDGVPYVVERTDWLILVRPAQERMALVLKADTMLLGIFNDIAASVSPDGNILYTAWSKTTGEIRRSFDQVSIPDLRSAMRNRKTDCMVGPPQKTIVIPTLPKMARGVILATMLESMHDQDEGGAHLPLPGQTRDSMTNARCLTNWSTFDDFGRKVPCFANLGAESRSVPQAFLKGFFGSFESAERLADPSSPEYAAARQAIARFEAACREVRRLAYLNVDAIRIAEAPAVMELVQPGSPVRLCTELYPRKGNTKAQNVAMWRTDLQLLTDRYGRDDEGYAKFAVAVTFYTQSDNFDLAFIVEHHPEIWALIIEFGIGVVFIFAMSRKSGIVTYFDVFGPLLKEWIAKNGETLPTLAFEETEDMFTLETARTILKLNDASLGAFGLAMLQNTNFVGDHVVALYQGRLKRDPTPVEFAECVRLIVVGKWDDEQIIEQMAPK